MLRIVHLQADAHLNDKAGALLKSLLCFFLELVHDHTFYLPYFISSLLFLAACWFFLRAPKCILLFNSFPDDKILDWSKLKQIADNILTHSHTVTPFDALGNKPFENTVGKGEIARNEQFLLFQLCFLPVWITFLHFLQI